MNATISAHIQSIADQRIANGDWQQVEYAGKSTMGAEQYLVPSSTRRNVRHMCRRWPNGSWSCDCESRKGCHHPQLAEEKRQRMLFARAWESQWVTYMEGRA